MTSKILDLFQGKTFDSPPLWFMRQAGRYLPEYRKVREQFPSFLDLCFSPSAAAEVTLQPLKRFDFDGVILFSDILTIPYGLGQKIFFDADHGPQLSELSLSTFQEKLSFDHIEKTMAPVYETLHLVQQQLPSSKALFGFSGAPWTLALYMLEGKGTRDFSKAKQEAFQEEKHFSLFLEFLSQAISSHLIEQIKAGATVLQLFDTWAGLCPATHFQQWIIEPTQAILASVKKAFPHVPLIGFPKGIGTNLVDYAVQCGFSGLSLDSSTPLPWAVKNCPQDLILQGNLDPLILSAGRDTLKRAIYQIHHEMEGRPYIFNLGHGIVPQTPLKNVEDCVKWVRHLK